MAIDVEIDGHIATVTMNRPEALNAFNAEQLDLLIDAFRSLADNTSVRAVVLTGAGDRAFAAGADIKADGRDDPGRRNRLRPQGSRRDGSRGTAAATGHRRGERLRLRWRL